MLVIQISKQEYQKIMELVTYVNGFINTVIEHNKLNDQDKWYLDMASERIKKAKEMLKNLR